MEKTKRSQASPKRLSSNQYRIHLYNRQRDLPLPRKEVKEAASSVLSFLQSPCQEIALYFVSVKEISRLHAEHFDDPSPTDCITFPLEMSEEDGFLGEIFVCPRVALEYAARRNLSPLKETLLYVIHGLLHLHGYDDLEPKLRRAMRKKEKACMDHLRGLSFWNRFC